ncbi:serine/threonine-protein kinase [Amycolatopsis taiwanensis]|uniref:serine/threonine-protein kinase n=1 Tax=Amycolatopsis taiwanensis TaxID=342230 RepID=UPI0004819BAA|nr:serine/threonine-protein kinase [Amycolatopsis taiwanensis]
MSDEGRLVAGRYRVVRRIGSGAMGAVWQAYDEVLARTVAIKQLLLQPGLDQHEAEDAKQRTMREGRIAARLHHPNAITVFDVVTDDNGHPCLVMEYLQSTSLAEVLRDQKTLPPMDVARIGAQIAAALKEAHAVGIVHRDIKPGNILLADNGLVKITDFGISRAKDDVTVTKTGMIAGTPAYLAPEVAIGSDPGPESDIFSLGSTLYAACEGQPPFGLSENTLGLLHAVAAGQINPPRQSGPMASVLAVLLHPDVEHRPTAAETEELLSAVARGETPLGGTAGDPTQLASAAGLLGGPGATMALPSDAVAPGGTPSDGFYDDYDYDDGYGRTTAYPANDYDQTRRAPVAGGHDGYPPDGEPGQNERKSGKWKAAAIAGGAAAVLVGLVVWLFSGPGKVDNNSNNNTNTPPPPATSSSMVQTTETATETVTASSSQSPSANTKSSKRSTNTQPSNSDETSNTSSSKHSSSSSAPSSPPKTPTGTSTSPAGD